jgi:hypothetical protein
LCLLNFDDKRLAKSFDVSEVTINAWKKKHPKFLKSIKEGKEKADAKVAASLFERATGYSHPEDKIFAHTVSDKEFNDKGKMTNITQHVEITTVPTTKHYPPDTAAAFIWLKNRQGWRDDSNVNINDNRLTKEEIEGIRAKLDAKYIEARTMDGPGD